MKNFVSTYRSLLLLGVLITSMVSSAFSETHDGGIVILFIAYILLGMGGAYLLGAGPRLRIAAWAIVVPIILFELLLMGGTRESLFLNLAVQLCSMGLVGLLLAVVFKYTLLSSMRVNKVDRILAGVCGYLLIALFWSNIYAAIEVIASGSIEDSAGGELTRLDFLYFSLTSLTTLGYGDILPITGPARIFSVLEAVFGVLYLAIFVSALVAMPEKK